MLTLIYCLDRKRRKETLCFNSNILVCQVDKDIIVFISFVDLIQSRDIWEERNSNEKMVPPDWSMGKMVGCFLR